VVPLRDLAGAGAVVEKTEFSCTVNPDLNARLAGSGRDQVVICGIEAHVCVLQTALGLLPLDLVPVVVADATSSRREASRELALARMGRAGVEVVTTEMVLFEWLERAATPEFKELSALIR